MILETIQPNEKVYIEKKPAFHYLKPAWVWLNENERFLNREVPPGCLKAQNRMQAKNPNKMESCIAIYLN